MKRPKVKVGRAPARTGNNALEEWFSLSYASWLTLPRILMADMPDKWQAQMARLLTEFTHEYPELDLYTLVQLTAGENRKFIATPDWLTRQGYRHPEFYRHELNKVRGLPPGKIEDMD